MNRTLTLTCRDFARADRWDMRWCTKKDHASGDLMALQGEPVNGDFVSVECCMKLYWHLAHMGAQDYHDCLAVVVKALPTLPRVSATPDGAD